MRVRGRKVRGQAWDVVTLAWVVAAVVGAGGVMGSTGHYAISGPEYVGTVTHAATSTYRIALHTLVAGT